MKKQEKHKNKFDKRFVLIYKTYPEGKLFTPKVYTEQGNRHE